VCSGSESWRDAGGSVFVFRTEWKGALGFVRVFFSRVGGCGGVVASIHKRVIVVFFSVGFGTRVLGRLRWRGANFGLVG
jgi:hypothetical protein